MASQFFLNISKVSRLSSQAQIAYQGTTYFAFWRKLLSAGARYTVSPGDLQQFLKGPENAEHIALDFMKKPEEIAEALKGKEVKACAFKEFLLKPANQR